MSHRGGVGFVKVAEDERSSRSTEIRTENDGSVLLSTLKRMFPMANGLKYKAGAGGGWRAVRVSGNTFHAPQGGFGNNIYYATVTKPEPVKRKHSPSPREDRGGGKTARYNENLKLLNVSDEDLLKDIVVLALPFKCTDDDLRDYFTNECGELAYSEVKYDRDTKKAKGFGFIRFKRVEAARKSLNRKHVIMGRTLEIRISKNNKKEPNTSEPPMRLFVGRIPHGTTRDDLITHFSQFGVISDAHVSMPFRGFGFITFASQEEARVALRKDHKIKDTSLNVVLATPPPNEGNQGNQGNQGNHDNVAGGDSYQMDSRHMDPMDQQMDNRGPRDFRDPVERNQTEKSTRDKIMEEIEARDRERGVKNANMRDGGGVNMGGIGGMRDSRDMGGNGGRRDRDGRDRIPQENELHKLREAIRDQREVNRSQGGNGNYQQGNNGNYQQGNSRDTANYGGSRESRDFNDPQRGDSRGINDYRGPVDSRDHNHQQRGHSPERMNFTGSRESRDFNDRQQGDSREINDYRGSRDSRDFNDQQQRNSRDTTNYRGPMIPNDRNNVQGGDSRERNNYSGPMDSRDRNNQQHRDFRDTSTNQRGPRDSRDQNIPQQQRGGDSRDYRGPGDTRDRNTQPQGDSRDFRGPRDTRDRNTQIQGDSRERKDYRGSRDFQDNNTQQRGNSGDRNDHRGSRDRNSRRRGDSRERNDYRESIFLNNQSKYDSRHDLQNMKQRRPQKPNNQELTAELENMVYQFLGSLK